MTEIEASPTARERALFDAASQPFPEEFVRLCKVIDRDPRHVLARFDAAPWRWLIVGFATPAAVPDAIRELSFPTDVQARLEVTRQYVERSWWRRVLRP